MRRLSIVLSLAVAVAACKKSEPPAAPAAPGIGAAPGAPAQAAPAPIRGKVLERLDAEPYSYLRLETPGGEVWAAVYKADVAKGAEVTVEGPMPMVGFESKTLNRKFDKVFFGTLAGQQAAPPSRAGGPGGMPPGAMPPGAMPPAGQPAQAGGAPGKPGADPHAGMQAPPGMPPGGMAGLAAQHAGVSAAPADVGPVKVEKAQGANARTVAEIHSQKGQLKGKPVAVRGKVVKYNAGIMGKNWLHLRDGTGSDAKKDNDLTVTTAAQDVQVGDVVLVSGKVAVDKDFGSGYTYGVIVEEATVTKK